MILLIATDNTFFDTPDGVKDVFCFDRGFFDDYRSEFEEVVVAARMRTSLPPSSAHQADGDGVRFVGLTDVHGARWALAPMDIYCRSLPGAVRAADAVCVRLPSMSGVFAGRLARRWRIPLMFELIGDPERALATSGLSGRLLGLYFGYWTRRLAKHATAGSYVNLDGMRGRYPAGDQTATDGISSIRLPDAEIRPARVYDGTPARLRVVLVGSLFPVKDQATLVHAAAIASQSGVPLAVDLVGDGPLRERLSSVVKSLGLQATVTLHGHVTGAANVTRLLDAADVFAMPSIDEGMPRAMIEAMARGLPVIGSTAPAITSLLTKEQLFAVGDAGALADLLGRAYREPALLNRWAAHSERTVKQFAQSVLSPRRRRLLRILRRAAEQNRRTHG